MASKQTVVQLIELAEAMFKASTDVEREMPEASNVLLEVASVISDMLENETVNEDERQRFDENTEELIEALANKMGGTDVDA